LIALVEKLALCDLLDDTLVAYAATRPDVYVIPTLKNRIGGKSRVKAEKRLGEAASRSGLGRLGTAREEPHPCRRDITG
jgi:hypothetical protein